MSRSKYAKNYVKGFKKKSMPMLALYRRFLKDMRRRTGDESRQLICLPPSKLSVCL